MKNKWREAIRSGDFTKFGEKPVVSKSWTRSAGFGINPYQLNNKDDQLSSYELREYRDKYSELVFIANPIINDLYFRLKGTNTAIFLISKEGYILKALGDDSIMSVARKIMLVEGANWHENSKGTNGIGTALLEQAPVDVLGEEHFCEPLHHLGCFAAPIFDINQSIIGLLDVTTLSKHTHKCLFAFVSAASKAIETQLYAYNLKKKLIHNAKQSFAILEHSECGIIRVDQAGHITNVNSMCSNLLHLDNHQLVGSSIENILPLKTSFKDMLKKGFVCDSEHLEIEYKQDKYTCELKQIYGPLGETLGAAFYITPRKSILIVKAKSVQPQMASDITFDNIIGNCQSIKSTFKLARRAAATKLNILLTGETGTGKEVFARAMHNESVYYKGPFIAINCGAIPETLIESELFGYEDGAFTGAKKGGRMGKFEIANKGTVFLDEVGEMPLHMQVKLLRFIQEREFVRVGGNKTISVDIRLIAATNRDLKEEVKQGRFRQDLFYRLNGLNIHIPPLVERKEDIIPLAEHFLEKTGFRCMISPTAINMLINYNWPGNVRELENVIERAASLCDEGIIKPNNLPEEIKQKKQVIMSDVYGKTYKLREMESVTIYSTLKKYNGNCTMAAKELGISRTTLYRKLKQYNIDKEEFLN
ncbi:Transcriptional regulator of acetoin/glycerol metabolism [Desulfotomaculum arcticum]|uniref:Transcriptional regulator of acetoin/glycerol metabolism n=1 Tax=Desulfotruncus arcticus DSM 17038 TaxID=1121424 RepID=A0A1I2XN88_9FIRM|nr:sigma-54-dependent Fis family transcriptional regulator [Desulfotruncus arcticus]SFH14509.1 Transcriptional regulator of acetoin/glycerol metabolism [Desulfotomaculum arcticum] [Desulfotruncus arcticus DSM 17038]